MAFSTKRVYITSEIVDNFAPVGHGVQTAKASIGVERELGSFEEAITRSTDVNSNKVTAFDALINTSLVSAIDARINTSGDGDLGVDTTTHTVSYNARIFNIRMGASASSESANDILLPAANSVFLIKYHLSINVS